jgi:hypothetical protein
VHGASLGYVHEPLRIVDEPDTVPAHEPFEACQPFIDRIADLVRRVSGGERVPRMQDAAADVVEVNQLGFCDRQSERRPCLLVARRDLKGRGLWDWEEIGVDVSQLLDDSAQAPIFREAVMVP